MSNLSTSLVLFIAISFLGVATLNIDFIETGKHFLAQAGSMIGVSASVPPNPYNTVAKQIDEKNRELALREEELQERERILREGSGNPFVYYAVGISLALVCVNFALDFRRRRPLS